MMVKETMQNAGATHNAVANETTIVGKIVAQQDIRIDGTLEGRLECQGRVIVGVNGRVLGDIVAESADIAGRVVGNVVVTGMLMLKATAFVEGDVQARQLSVEPSATLNGKCSMVHLDGVQ